MAIADSIRYSFEEAEHPRDEYGRFANKRKEAVYISRKLRDSAKSLSASMDRGYSEISRRVLEFRQSLKSLATRLDKQDIIDELQDDFKDVRAALNVLRENEPKEKRYSSLLAKHNERHPDDSDDIRYKLEKEVADAGEKVFDAKRTIGQHFRHLHDTWLQTIDKDMMTDEHFDNEVDQREHHKYDIHAFKPTKPKTGDRIVDTSFAIREQLDSGESLSEAEWQKHKMTLFGIMDDAQFYDFRHGFIVGKYSRHALRYTFEELDHPRDDIGRFTDKNIARSTPRATDYKTREEWNRALDSYYDYPKSSNPQRDAMVAEWTGLIDKALAQKGLTKAARERHLYHVNRVVSLMPDKAVERLVKWTQEIRLCRSPEEVRIQYNKHVRKKWKQIDGRLEIRGFYANNYVYPHGKLVIGLVDEGDVDHTQSGIAAHEMTHAVDGPINEFSRSEEWKTAWEEEITGGNLSEYAATNSIEGFAEFGRLVYSEHDWEETAEALFPKCTAYWRSQGLA